jgi:hypothetical protein
VAENVRGNRTRLKPERRGGTVSYDRLPIRRDSASHRDPVFAQTGRAHITRDSTRGVSRRRETDASAVSTACMVTLPMFDGFDEHLRSQTTR